MKCLFLWLILWGCGLMTRYVIGTRWDVYGCPLLVQEPCDAELVRFFLTTPDSASYELLAPDFPLPESFEIDIPTKIIIHGFGDFLNDSVTLMIWENYSKIGYNVIMVDWNQLSKSPCYPASAVNTVHVGQCVGQFLFNFALRTGTPFEHMHVIGFSLGAHIAGFTSQFLMETTGYRLGRISGLDPAMPLFTTWDNKFKLDKTDANFVDIIHTCAGSNGKIEATGHVDFYVNGGSIQPMCDLGSIFKNLACSHTMAGIYYAESIIGSKQFIGVQCPNLFTYLLGWCKESLEMAIMGHDATPMLNGTFYLDTALTPPYALGQVVFRKE